MWQIQWMISLIPDFILNWLYWGIIALGLTGLFASWFGKFIPFYGRYTTILKPVGIALLVLGVWLRGGYDVEMAWRAKVAELEAKIVASEQKSKDYNKKLDGAIKEKNNAIKEKDKAIKNRITVVKNQIDRECTVDSIAIQILNESAREPKVKK